MLTSSARRTLLDLCIEVTGTTLDREVDASISLFDLGLTEAQVPLLCKRIKKAVGVSISVEDILATQEIGAIAALLEDAATIRPATRSVARSTKALKWLSVALLFPAVAGFDTSLGFELDADGCVMNYDERCAAKDENRHRAHIACVSKVGHQHCAHSCAAPAHGLLTLTVSDPMRAQHRLLPAHAPCHDRVWGWHLPQYRHESTGLFDHLPR